MSTPNPFDTENSFMYSPLMGLAAGLLQAGGPSRMPVGLGQALGQGLQQGQQFQQAGIQNKLGQINLAQQMMMLPLTQAKLNWMTGGQGNPSPNQQTTPAPITQDALQQTAATQQAAQSPQSSPAQPSSMNIGGPIPQGITDVSQDPTYANLAAGARLGIPDAASLAEQRRQIVMNSPEYQAAVERAKSYAGLQNVRQGGAVFDPTSGQVLFQNPHLPVGGILNSDRSVGLAPGALPAIAQSEQAEAQGSLFGKPATVQSPSGAEIQTTVGNALFPNQPGGSPGNVAKLSPAVTAGMTTTGDEATKRANEAIEKQPATQQTIGQLGQLEANLSALGASPGKEAQLAVKNSLSSVGGFLGMPGLANADLTNAAAARKTIVNLTAPMVRAMGAREPYQMVTFIKNGMASIDNPADANGVVIGMLRGLAEYQNATGKYAGDFLNQNNGTGFAPGKGAWDATWQKQSDPMAFIMENLPQFEQQSIIKAAQNNKTLQYELQRAAKSKKLMQQMGYMQGDNGG